MYLEPMLPLSPAISGPQPPVVIFSMSCESSTVSHNVRVPHPTSLRRKLSIQVMNSK